MKAKELFFKRIADATKNEQISDIFKPNVEQNSVRAKYAKALERAIIQNIWPSPKTIEKLSHLFEPNEFEIITKSSREKPPSIKIEWDRSNDPLINLYYDRIKEHAGRLSIGAVLKLLTNELELHPTDAKIFTHSIRDNYIKKRLPTIDTLINTSDLFTKEEIGNIIHLKNRTPRNKSKFEETTDKYEETIIYATSKRDKKRSREKQNIYTKQLVSGILDIERQCGQD